jgi:hypothetical protein
MYIYVVGIKTSRRKGKIRQRLLSHESHNGVIEEYLSRNTMESAHTHGCMVAMRSSVVNGGKKEAQKPLYDVIEDFDHDRYTVRVMYVCTHPC